ncbi:MAG: flagellar motor switch protein FliG, partial [Candidatus Zixiibacteriota bacterium]
VPPEIEEKVVEECHQIFMAREYISQGGIDFASEILESAVGPTKAREIMQRLESSLHTTGFSLLKDIDPKQLGGYLQNEHPQTVALILTQLSPQQAAQVLSELNPELQAEVALRIATMEKISPEVLKEIEQTLEGQFGSNATRDLSVSGGAKAIAEILNLIDSSAEKNILQSLEADDPDLAAEVKNMMFVFDDLILLDDRSVQRLLKEVETKDLAIALKAASEEVKNKIFANVSERVAVMIQEEMEFMGPTRLSDVEAAQGRIVEIVRRLEEEGQVIISGRGGKEDIIV